MTAAPRVWSSTPTVSADAMHYMCIVTSCVLCMVAPAYACSSYRLCVMPCCSLHNSSAHACSLLAVTPLYQSACSPDVALSSQASL